MKATVHGRDVPLAWWAVAQPDRFGRPIVLIDPLLMLVLVNAVPFSAN